MTERPYSINFDESTVNGLSEVTMNASYLNDNLLVEKRSLAVISMNEGTSGYEFANMALTELEEDNIDPVNMMSAKTDGCKAMIGVLLGAQKYLRDRVPMLPKFGGCIDHDLPNVLKAGVKVLCKHVLIIYPAMFGCLAKHSKHKKWDFEAIEEWVGSEIRKVPKFIDVRFRYVSLVK